MYRQWTKHDKPFRGSVNFVHHHAKMYCQTYTSSYNLKKWYWQRLKNTNPRTENLQRFPNLKCDKFVSDIIFKKLKFLLKIVNYMNNCERPIASQAIDLDIFSEHVVHCLVTVSYTRTKTKPKEYYSLMIYS